MKGAVVSCATALAVGRAAHRLLLPGPAAAAPPISPRPSLDLSADTIAIIEKMYKRGGKMVVATTGSGGYALSSLCKVSGMSNLIMEIRVPYDVESSSEYLNGVPEKFVSEKTAIDMAMRSHQRALELHSRAVIKKGLGVSGSPGEEEQDGEALEAKQQDPHRYARALCCDGGGRCVGIGCTAAVVSTRPRRGKHHAFVASFDGNEVRVAYLDMSKGARDRSGEDTCIGALIIKMAAESVGITVSSEYLPRALRSTELKSTTSTGDLLNGPRAIPISPLEQLIKGRASSALFFECKRNKASWVPEPKLPRGSLLLPGSFNPIHRGHVELGLAARDILWKLDKEGSVAAQKRPLFFEISINNADKGGIQKCELEKRLSQFESVEKGPFPVVVTNAKLFKQKSVLFPGCWFVVGFDTAIRVVDPKYYGDCKWRMCFAIKDLMEDGVRMVVGARKSGSGQLSTLQDVYRKLQDLDQNIFDLLKDFFVEIPSDRFRLDISSTELRMRAKKSE